MTVPVPADQQQGPPPPAESTVLTVVPADNIVTLVSNCVVNQRAWMNNCGVPLGAHVDFIPSAQLNLPQITRLPVRCKGCTGFMNVYCKVSCTALGRWMALGSVWTF